MYLLFVGVGYVWSGVPCGAWVFKSPALKWWAPTLAVDGLVPELLDGFVGAVGFDAGVLAALFGGVWLAAGVLAGLVGFEFCGVWETVLPWGVAWLPFPPLKTKKNNTAAIASKMTIIPTTIAAHHAGLA